jgi:hypothetical protein
MIIKIAPGFKTNREVLAEIGAAAKLNKPAGHRPALVWQNTNGKKKYYGFNFEDPAKFKLSKTYPGHSGNPRESGTCKVVSIIKY